MKKQKKAYFNTITDTGFLFEVGNSMIGFVASFKAGIISLSIAALCFLARLAGEHSKNEQAFFAKSDGQNLFKTVFYDPLASLVSLMAKSLGTSLMISGTALIIAGFFAIDYDAITDFYPASKEALILFLFGFANGLRGLARGFEDNGFSQRLFDVIGIFLAAMGVILAGEMIVWETAAPLGFEFYYNLGVKALFILATLVACYEAIRLKAIHALLKGDLIFALGCIGNATLVWEHPNLLIANCLFALACVSLHALKTHSGLYEQLFK